MKRKGENSCEIEERLARAAESSLKTKSISPVLREELRLSILNRRHANGQDDIHVEFKEPVKHELTPAEIEKKLRRREQNRRAARRCREKKKRNQEGTFVGLAQIIEENKCLEAEISLLKSQKDAIQRFLDLHKSCLQVKEEEPESPSLCFEPSGQSVNQTLSDEIDILHSLQYSCQLTNFSCSQGQASNDNSCGDSLPQSVVEFCLEHPAPEENLFLDYGSDMRRQTVSVSSVSSEADIFGTDSDTDTIFTNDQSGFSECSEDEDVFQPTAHWEVTGSQHVLACEALNESYLPLDTLAGISEACESENACGDVSLLQYLNFAEP